MIDVILKVIDRVIQLSEYRQERNKEIFEKFIEPIYEDSSKVYADYRGMFRKSIKLIQEDKIDEAIAGLQNDREQYIATRAKLLEMRGSKVETMRSDNDREDTANGFGELKFFFADDVYALLLFRAEQRNTRVTRSTSVIRMLVNSKENSKGSRKEILEYALPVLDRTLTDLDQTFQSLSAMYGRLRAIAYFEDDLSRATKNPRWPT